MHNLCQNICSKRQGHIKLKIRWPSANRSPHFDITIPALTACSSYKTIASSTSSSTECHLRHIDLSTRSFIGNRKGAMQRSNTPRRRASGIQDQESIKVFVRIRPLLSQESSTGERSSWKATGETTLTCLDDLLAAATQMAAKSPLTSGSAPAVTSYSYNKVFPEDSTSDNVYETTTHPMVQAALQGGQLLRGNSSKSRRIPHSFDFYRCLRHPIRYRVKYFLLTVPMSCHHQFRMQATTELSLPTAKRRVVRSLCLLKPAPTIGTSSHLHDYFLMAGIREDLYDAGCYEIVFRGHVPPHQGELSNLIGFPQRLASCVRGFKGP